jgi:hypothetical protein
MLEIREELIVDIYRSYQNAPHTRAKAEVLYEGVKGILFKLNRYTGDAKKLEERSKTAINELESMLNRFYYADKEFMERLLYEAKAFILEISSY